MNMLSELHSNNAKKFNQEVGKLIKNARKAKGVSQELLGQGVGLTRTSINNIEHGRQRIMLDTLLTISCILEITLIELLPSLNMDRPLEELFPENTPRSVRRWAIQGAVPEPENE
jgi:transcriptional regulator with XRE-family HTH domain